MGFVGLNMGPMYPILICRSNDILPKWLYTGALYTGITALQPFLVSMMSTLIVI
ncbi:hypothetical protein BDW22DRAFT_1355797 [Trametopsis cervina]|nr:hypothetical protein BDW22DRAFT_1355797 [Trametopsis cervina]